MMRARKSGETMNLSFSIAIGIKLEAGAKRGVGWSGGNPEMAHFC
jgi:hypothetical protein